MDDDRAGIAVGVSVELDAGEIGRCLAKDNAEEKVGAERDGRDDVGGVGRRGFDQLCFAAVGEVAGDTFSLGAQTDGAEQTAQQTTE